MNKEHLLELLNDPEVAAKNEVRVEGLIAEKKKLVEELERIKTSNKKEWL